MERETRVGALAWLRNGISGAIDAQRGALLPWGPVCLGIGIASYFALLDEPSVAVWALLICVAVVLCSVVLSAGVMRWPLVVGLLLVVSGFLLAGARTHLVAGPVLGFRYYGPVEGRIIALDRSVGDRVRLTLDHVVMQDMRPHRVPERVRVSLQPDQPGALPVPGKTVAMTVHLSPPSGPVEPGGFDFQRMAWFDGLGAVGYTKAPLVTLAPAPAGFSVARWRNAISREVQARLPGEVGAFAAAVTTGDRAGMAQGSLTALRQSNLAHLLAISGLHMGLLTAFVFGALRLALVTVPAISLGWPVKKIAAVGALLAGAVYLALSGGNVATQRAYAMVAVMLIAVLLDRRAVTLRSVAVAAMIVLVLQPESLSEPGFQMSFSATIALVAAFRVARDLPGEWVPGWARPALATIFSSAVAGAATAPVAAAHFNMIAHYGLFANLASVPLMGLVVMPGAVLAACLAPFGMHGIGLAVMAPGIEWILAVADWTARQDGAVGHVVSPGPWVLPLFALGMLWLILWRGRARWAGLAPALLAFGLWALAERPALLVSPGGGLIGLMTEQGRALSKARGDGFAAQSWLENDGDIPDQGRAAARWPQDKAEAGIRTFTVGTMRVVHLSGRGASMRVAEGCAKASLVILAADARGIAPAGCKLWDRRALEAAGGFALYDNINGTRTVTARAAAGRRPWNAAQ